jgi:hypothetical protein
VDPLTILRSLALRPYPPQRRRISTLQSMRRLIARSVE